MKVPHHGSRNQSGRLTQWFPAALGLISVGKGNRYGHPAQSTILQLGGSGHEGGSHRRVRRHRCGSGRCWRPICGGAWPGVAGDREILRGGSVDTEVMAERIRGVVVGEDVVPNSGKVAMALIVGSEALLVERAIDEVVAAARRQDPEGNVVNLMPRIRESSDLSKAHVHQRCSVAEPWSSSTSWSQRTSRSSRH